MKENQGLATCPFCGSSLYLDLREGVGHFCIKPALTEKSLSSQLTTWLLHKERRGAVRIEKAALVFWPFWEIQSLWPEGEVFTSIAASHPITDMQHSGKVPTGELIPFVEEELKAARVKPPQYAIREFMKKEGISRKNEGSPLKAVRPGPKAWLIHIPFWQVEYICDGVSYEAWIEAVSGDVFADDLPPTFAREKDRIYQRAVAVIFFAYLLAGIFVPSGNLAILVMVGISLPLYLLVRGMVKEEAG